MMKIPSPLTLLFRRTVAVPSLALLLTSHMASAQVVWDGGAGTTSWLDGLNWDTNAVPSGAATSITTGAAVQLSGLAPTILNLTLSGGSSLNVMTGGTMTIQDPVVAAGSTLTISGGRLNYRRIGSFSGSLVMTDGLFNRSSNASIGNVASAAISGGTWNLNSNPYTFGNGAASSLTVSGSGVVTIASTLSFGETTNAATVSLSGNGRITASNFSQVRGTVMVSGGTLSTAGNYDWAGTPTGTNKVLRVVGGTGSLSVGGNFTATGSAGTRDFVLTAQNSGVTQENISTLLVGGTDNAGGNVDAGLQGGILLADPTVYNLISAGTLGGTITYVGTDLYDGAASGNNYQITLDAARDQGSITLPSMDTPVSEAFSLVSVGYVDLDITSVVGDSPTLFVRLDADAGSSTLTDMVTYLSQSGYSNVMLDSFGAYDISFEIDSAFLSDGTMYLGWDFTEFAAGAGLSGVQISAVPEPGVAWLVGAAGVSCLLWRRRRQA